MSGFQRKGTLKPQRYYYKDSIVDKMQMINDKQMIDRYRQMKNRNRWIDR